MEKTRVLPENFDVLLLGLGAANSLILLQLARTGYLAQHRVAVLEPEAKLANDRTFCFWATPEELKALQLEYLISAQWNRVQVSGSASSSIEPMRYYHVRGIDLYEQAREVLKDGRVRVFRHHLQEAPELVADGGYLLRVGDQVIQAKRVLDSRPARYALPAPHQTHLYQSFLGWKIRTDEPVFDPTVVTMMDFEVEQSGFTQFVYVLPYSDRSALVELTRFGKECLTEDLGVALLSNYLQDKVRAYQIEEVERGVIPMSTAAIQVEDYGLGWIPTGSRAGLVKPSTGYAFKSMAREALLLVDGLKKEPAPYSYRSEKRFRFYDQLLLRILEKKPHWGKPIFEQLFRRVPMTRVLGFLQERTSITQDIAIFTQLPVMPFLGAAVQTIAIQGRSWLPFALTMLLLWMTDVGLSAMAWSMLVLGFLLVGLPHGALDHLLSTKRLDQPPDLGFVLGYLLKGAAFGLLWWWQPSVALIGFIAYSAWHFGQADFEEWGIKSWLGSFFWGLSTLGLILFTHVDELTWVLLELRTNALAQAVASATPGQLALLLLLPSVPALLLSRFSAWSAMLRTWAYLLLASFLPLLMAFGIFFIAQHSLHAWTHLRLRLGVRSFSLWKKAMPFTLGALLLFLIFAALLSQGVPINVGHGFIFLSCISFPHVLSMHHFYQQRP